MLWALQLRTVVLAVVVLVMLVVAVLAVAVRQRCVPPVAHRSGIVLGHRRHVHGRVREVLVWLVENLRRRFDRQQSQAPPR